MLVFELIGMFTEEQQQYFELWDNATEKIIYKGYLNGLTENLSFAEVTSIDNITNGTKGITLNIDIP